MAKSANPDAEVAALARRQHGIVCFDQLLAAGRGPSGIALRVRTGRLPRIHRGVYVGPHEVDFLWRSHRLIVETDGWETHRDRASFEADRARDAELKLMGYEVVRFTYRQVLEEPERVARVLWGLLSR